MGVVMARLGFPCTSCAFVIAVTLFGLSSAQVIKWTKQSPDPLFGVLGENVSFEWNFTVTGNDKIFDFRLEKWKGSNPKDIVTYQPNGLFRVSAEFKGKFGMATNVTHPAFILVNAETNDEARYCCKVATRDGYDDRRCTNLQILVRPNITGISRNQTLNETNDVTLSCNATGKPPPNVTWSRPGNRDKKCPGSVLPLKNISREQDGEYWCTATNRVGNATASVRVTVNYAPSITPNSTRYNFTEGNDIELRCITDGRPQSIVTWTKIGESSNKVYPDGQTLIIANVNRTEAGTYRCTATNGIGNSASVAIHVNIFFPPSIDKGPTNETVNESSDLELFCNATGNPPPNITWSKVAVPPVQFSFDEVLTVTNINKTDSGVYQCRASNGIGSDAFASSVVTVRYKPEGTRLTSDAQNDAVTENFQVTFHCTADSVPPPELELLFDNSSLGFFINNKFSLAIVNASNQGTYKCVPRNILGTGPAATLNLTVLVSPSIDYISQNITVNETDDVILFCNSTGNPSPNITWKFLDNSTKVTFGERLSLQRVNRSQAGTYRCTATNGGQSKAWAEVHVQVNYKPEMRDGPSVVKSWINHETEVTCEAEGFPAPEIVWSRKGTVTSSTTLNSCVSSLKFTPEEKDEFGILLCSAKNLLGTGKKNITVKQLVVPAPPRILRIDSGVDNMEIHWEVSAGDPDSPVLNYLVQVKEKDGSYQWMNCARITPQKSSGSMLCVMNELKSGTEYTVRIAARNVVGYSAFTENHSSTKRETGKKEEQKGLPKSTIYGIIAGGICFLALVIAIAAIVCVKKRRSRSRGVNKEVMSKSSKKVTITNYDNPAMESKTEDPKEEL